MSNSNFWKYAFLIPRYTTIPGLLFGGMHDKANELRGRDDAILDGYQEGNPYNGYDVRDSMTALQKIGYYLGDDTSFNRIKQQAALDASRIDYDSPVQQAAREREAGLNPDLTGLSGSSTDVNPNPEEMTSGYDELMGGFSQMLNVGLGLISQLQNVSLANYEADITGFNALGGSDKLDQLLLSFVNDKYLNENGEVDPEIMKDYDPSTMDDFLDPSKLSLGLKSFYKDFKTKRMRAQVKSYIQNYKSSDLFQLAKRKMLHDVHALDADPFTNASDDYIDILLKFQQALMTDTAAYQANIAHFNRGVSEEAYTEDDAVAQGNLIDTERVAAQGSANTDAAMKSAVGDLMKELQDIVSKGGRGSRAARVGLLLISLFGPMLSKFAMSAAGSFGQTLGAPAPVPRNYNTYNNVNVGM